MYELWGEYLVIIFSGKGKQWELGLRLCHKEILTDLSTRLSSILMTSLTDFLSPPPPP